MIDLAPVRPRREDDDMYAFRDANLGMDDWIRRQIERARVSRASRMFVVTARDDDDVLGYHWLAPHFVVPARRSSVSAPPSAPIPVILIGRIAVRADRQRLGIGSTLLADVMRRAIPAADAIGARALIAHAATPELGVFYRHFGFRDLGTSVRQGMFLPLPETPRF